MSFIALDYLCESCQGLTDSLEERSSPSEMLRCKFCNGKAYRCISPVRGKTTWAWAERGAIDEPPPGAMTTRHLAKE